MAGKDNKLYQVKVKISTPLRAHTHVTIPRHVNITYMRMVLYEQLEQFFYHVSNFVFKLGPS